MWCKFDLAWRGYCGEKTVKGKTYCKDHLNKECVICGSQATHECTWASSLSCCAPLCNKRECWDKHNHRC